MAKPSKAWKAMERRVAKFWRTTRNALSGINSKVTGSDTHHPRLFIECKLNTNSPFWRLYQKALPVATKERKAVMLCLGKKNHKGYMVAFHISDLDKVVIERLINAGYTGSNLATITKALEASKEQEPLDKD